MSRETSPATVRCPHGLFCTRADCAGARASGLSIRQAIAHVTRRMDRRPLWKRAADNYRRPHED